MPVNAAPMRRLQPALKLTVFVGGEERQAHRPLYQVVLSLLHGEGIAGATATRGVMSFGGRRSIHSLMNEVSMENLPIIIEAIDHPVNIEHAAERLAELIGEHGLITIQTTSVARHVTEAIKEG